MTCEETTSGLHCSYVPTETGAYVINVCHLNNHVPAQPFHTSIREDVSQVSITGAGLKVGIYVVQTLISIGLLTLIVSSKKIEATWRPSWYSRSSVFLRV